MFIEFCLNFIMCGITIALTVVMACLAICAIKFTKIDFNKLFNNTDTDN